MKILIPFFCACKKILENGKSKELYERPAVFLAAPRVQGKGLNENNPHVFNLKKEGIFPR